MTDGILMKELISEKGFTLEEFAEKLSLTRQGLDKKLRNKSQFKQTEIQKVNELLELSREQSDAIFFTLCVDCKSSQETANEV